jgi:hypothetical protein
MNTFLKTKTPLLNQTYQHIIYLLIILLNYSLDETFMNILIDAPLGLLIGIKVKN